MYQSWHHSYTLPCMSNNPQALHSFPPTALGPSFAFFTVHRVTVQQLFVVTKRKRRRRPGPTGVFPLVLRRQAVAVRALDQLPRIVFARLAVVVTDGLFAFLRVTGLESLLATQPVAEQHRVVPTDTYNGQTWILSSGSRFTVFCRSAVASPPPGRGGTRRTVRRSLRNR